ncbi:unnamed protein product [Discosporangium mesarthrocarpum]
MVLLKDVSSGASLQAFVTYPNTSSTSYVQGCLAGPWVRSKLSGIAISRTRQPRPRISVTAAFVPGVQANTGSVSVGTRISEALAAGEVQLLWTILDLEAEGGVKEEQEGPGEATATVGIQDQVVLHSRVIEHLWGSGKRDEAIRVFDLARQDVCKRLESGSTDSSLGDAGLRSEGGGQQQPSGRRQGGLRSGTLWRKPGGGVPGLKLQLDMAVCHELMREKLARVDYDGVIDVMRASSNRPHERLTDPGQGQGQQEVGWFPNEETYAIALEACSKVSKNCRSTS